MRCNGGIPSDILFRFFAARKPAIKVKHPVTGSDVIAMPRFLSILSPLVLAACLSAPEPAASPATADPAVLTYWCGDGGALRLRPMRGGGMHVIGAEAHGIDLPAVPAGQERRYARAPYSLLVEGGDVVFSKEGRPALACTR